MFINKLNYVNHKTDLSGRELVKITEIIYLFDGQEANIKTLNPETQQYYKKLYDIQENASFEAKRPISIFEVLKIGL